MEEYIAIYRSLSLSLLRSLFCVRYSLRSHSSTSSFSKSHLILYVRNRIVEWHFNNLFRYFYCCLNVTDVSAVLFNSTQWLGKFYGSQIYFYTGLHPQLRSSLIGFFVCFIFSFLFINERIFSSKSTHFRTPLQRAR